MINFERFHFRHYSVNEGLSQNTVYSIIQDKYGFMWFCTQQGLNKFDGYSFSVYRNNPEDSHSLMNNFVNKIICDVSGNLWISSLGGKASRYDFGDDNFKNFFPAESDLKNFTYPITGIISDRSGNIISGVSHLELKIINSKKNTSGLMKVDLKKCRSELKEITNLFVDNAGNLWIGTWNSGLIKYNPGKKLTARYSFREGDESSLSNDRVRYIFQDSREILWVCTTNGFNSFDYRKNKFRRFLSDNSNSFNINKHTIECIEEDKNGNLWLGTKNSGLIRFDLNEKKFSHVDETFSSERDNRPDNIRSLYSDNSNNLWIGTFSHGIYKLDCERKKFYGVSNLVKSERAVTGLNPTSIAKDRFDNIWLGTYFKGLYKIDNHEKELICVQNKFEELKSQPHQTIICMHQDKESVWIGTLFNGMNKIDTADEKIVNYTAGERLEENYISSIIDFRESGNMSLWVSSKELGLLKFDKGSGVFTKYDLLRNFNKSIPEKIRFLLNGKDGKVWIGSDEGVVSLMDFDNGVITNYEIIRNKSHNENENYISFLHQDRDGNIWTGTLYNGLFKLDLKKDKITNYSKSNGFPDDTIRAILEDDSGNLWISTNQGLVKFNPASGQFRIYGTSDGLQSKEFIDGSCYRDNEGYFYFGGVNGLNFFRPQEIKDNPYIPQTVITDFQIFNQSVKNSHTNRFLKKNISLTNEIEFSYKESVFSFEFASLSYNDPESNQYSYKMEGFDKDWIHCGTRRQATYTNLDPGNYIFRVRSSNNDGVWNKNGASLRISITPPIWKRWWFKGIASALGAGAAGTVYIRRANKIENEIKSKEEFSRRLLDSQENERKRISKGLHDTIAHDILITKNKAVAGLKKHDKPDEVKKILNEISELASSTLNDVRSISYDLSPPQLERLGLTKAIKSIIKNSFDSTEIRYSQSIQNIDGVLPRELEINLYRIFQECFNNIIKHSNATKSSVSIIRDHKTVLITIWDNGVGIPKNKTEGLGLSGISERVKLYKGELVVESDKNRGTLIVITLPIK